MENKLVNYIKESKAELKKVVWPTRKQTTNHTILVVSFSLVMAAFLGAVDFGLSELIKLLLS